MKVFLTLILGLSAALSTVTTIPIESTGIDRIDELDDFSLMGVLDLLDLNDLIIIASMSPRRHQFIVDHYILSKHGAINNTTILVKVTERNTDGFTETSYLESIARYWSYSEICSGYECMLASLKVLCPISRDLEIQFNFRSRFDDVFMRKFESHVNTYCAHIPQTVTMTGKYLLIGQFQLPHVSRVLIDNPERYEQFDLAHTFPYVEHLEMTIDGRYALPQHLPNLTHFQLHDKAGSNFDLQAFGKKNPQIRHAELQIVGQIENIARVNELFPNLDSLHLKLVRADSVTVAGDQTELIRFRNVNSFTLDLTNFYGYCGYCGTGQFELTLDNLKKDKLTSIVFDQLESFKYLTQLNVDNVADQVDYIVQYETVTSLELSTDDFDYADLKRLVDALPKLKEITFATNTFEERLVERLMIETHLDTIHSVVRLNERIDIPELEAMLPTQWMLLPDKYVFNYGPLTFTRTQMN